MIWEGMHLCTEAVKVVILSINLIFEKMEALKHCEIVSSCEKKKGSKEKEELLAPNPWNIAALATSLDE